MADACASLASTTRLSPLGVAEEMESGDEGVDDFGMEEVEVGEETEEFSEDGEEARVARARRAPRGPT